VVRTRTYNDPKRPQRGNRAMCHIEWSPNRDIANKRKNSVNGKGPRTTAIRGNSCRFGAKKGMTHFWWPQQSPTQPKGNLRGPRAKLKDEYGISEEIGNKHPAPNGKWREGIRGARTSNETQ